MHYLIVFFSSALFFQLQITFPIILKFSAIFQDILQLMQITFVGLSIGGGVALLFPGKRTIENLFLIIGPLLIVVLLMMTAGIGKWPTLFVTTLPFVILGAILAAGLSVLKRPKVYIWDLMGAATGLVGGIFLLGPIHGETLLLFSSLLASSISMFSFYKRNRKLWLSVLSVVICTFVFFSQALFGNFDILRLIKKDSPFSQELHQYSHELLTKEDHHRITHRWSPLSRVDVLKIPYDPYLHFLGKDKVQRSQEEYESRGEYALSLFYDNFLYTVASKEKGRHYHPTLYHDFYKEPEVLIIGAGGGDEIYNNHKNNAKSITAVEINSATVHLMQNELKSASGDVFDKADIHVMDGRTYIKVANKKYDIIDISTQSVISLLYSQVSIENYLLTKEAFGDYLNRLKPDGILNLDIFYYVKGGNERERIINTAASALKQYGLKPSQHLAFITNHMRDEKWGISMGTLLLKKSDFSSKNINKLKKEVQDHDLLTLDFEPDSQKLKELISYRKSSVLKDDKPFFYLTESFLKKQKVVLFVISLLSLLVIAPLYIFGWYLRRNPTQKGEWLFSTMALLSCGFLGLGYTLIQASLIQKMNLIIGHPVWSIAAIIFSMLTSGAIGAYAFSRINWLGLRAILLLGSLYSTIIYLFIVNFLENILIYDVYLRVLLVLLFVFPCGFCISAVFPRLINALEKKGAGLGALGFGLNSLAMVIGMPLSLWWAVLEGFSMVGLWGSGVIFFTVFTLPIFDSHRPSDL